MQGKGFELHFNGKKTVGSPVDKKPSDYLDENITFSFPRFQNAKLLMLKHLKNTPSILISIEQVIVLLN